MRIPISRVVGTVSIALLLTVFGSRANTSTRVKASAFTFVQDSTRAKPAGAKERIFIENVDLWRYDRDIDTAAQILTGNVIFRHNDAYMYCDSAHLYQAQNRFIAFENVRIEQGDSLDISCSYLDYDGITMLARLREYVVMEHGENTLYTDSLDYDRVAGIGYYFDYGSIVDTLNILSSVYGEYSTITKKAIFNDSVVLENPNFTLYSDTLHYDTETKIADILGPTRIVGDSGVIYATRGAYDTELDRAYLMDDPVIESGTRWMTGDSIYYDRVAKVAELYRNVILKDTADQVALRGNYAEYHEDTEYGLARDRAYIEEYSSEDTLYVHAHLLEMSKIDSVANLFKGLGNVRLYRSDIQAVSDTIVYHTADSVMNCIGNPFVWSGKSQVTGDSITLYMKDGEMDYAHIRENAYLSSQIDDKHFDQMRGREVKAYFSENEMDSVWTHGNAEVIYYSLSEDSVVLEHTKSQCSDILMQFEEEELSKIKLIGPAAGSITPLFLLKEEQLFYPNFIWFPEGRPMSFEDIFKVTPKPGSSSVPIGLPKPETSEEATQLPALPPEEQDALKQIGEAQSTGRDVELDEEK